MCLYWYHFIAFIILSHDERNYIEMRRLWKGRLTREILDSCCFSLRMFVCVCVSVWRYMRPRLLRIVSLLSSRPIENFLCAQLLCPTGREIIRCSIHMYVRETISMYASIWSWNFSLASINVGIQCVVYTNRPGLLSLHSRLTFNLT